VQPNDERPRPLVLFRLADRVDGPNIRPPGQDRAKAACGAFPDPLVQRVPFTDDWRQDAWCAEHDCGVGPRTTESGDRSLPHRRRQHRGRHVDHQHAGRLEALQELEQIVNVGTMSRRGDEHGIRRRNGAGESRRFLISSEDADLRVAVRRLPAFRDDPFDQRRVVEPFGVRPKMYGARLPRDIDDHRGGSEAGTRALIVAPGGLAAPRQATKGPPDLADTVAHLSTPAPPATALSCRLTRPAVP
jgi:hypothetical protein